MSEAVSRWVSSVRSGLKPYRLAKTLESRNHLGMSGTFTRGSRCLHAGSQLN